VRVTESRSGSARSGLRTPQAEIERLRREPTSDHTTSPTKEVIAAKHPTSGATPHRIHPDVGRHRLDEFNFRYNTRGVSDGQRTITALGQADGQRLTYQQARQPGSSER